MSDQVRTRYPDESPRLGWSEELRLLREVEKAARAYLLAPGTAQSKTVRVPRQALSAALAALDAARNTGR
jgi:hypothetical protein